MKKEWIIIAIVVVIAAIAVGVFVGQKNEAQKKVDELTAQVTSLQAELADAKKAAEEAQAAVEEAEAAEAARLEAEALAKNTLIMGSTTELSGDFFTELWGNNAMDKAVKELVHGYDMVPYTKDNGFQIDPMVVEDLQTAVNEDGSKTFTYKLAEDMTYNDGTPIKAHDFAFSFMLLSAPQVTEIGGDTAGGVGLEIVGYEAFNKGEVPNFAGVRMLDDYTIEVTMDAEYVPYFFELTKVSTRPYPIHIIAPGCEVVDDGEGVYIKGDFTAEVLEKTILDPQEGYRFNPKVTCGAYDFVEFNKESMQATVKRNPLFKGNYKGIQPAIETIVMKKVIAATMMSELEAGQVDMLQGCTEGAVILAGLELTDKGGVEYNTYLRSGFGFFTFACEEGTPTYYPEVRRAIAYCIDVPEFARQFTQGFGQVVYGYYGAAQWMAQQYRDELAENLNTYALSLENAKAELEAGGWVLNEKGEPFVDGTDTLRYKDIDGELMPCKIMWASSADNAVSDLIMQMLPENMRAVGMDIEQTTMQFAELLEYYYQPNTKDIPDGRGGYQMFNLATNFTAVFDPRFYYHTDDSYLGVSNSSGLQDQELTDLAYKMLNLDGSQADEYAAAWLEWQTRWNELLPTVPLYSNEYFDFFSTKLQGFEADSLWSWYWAVIDGATIEG